jgi:probable rRNA maturation factor
LSFPAPVFVRGFAGDIAISADIASQNARSLGHRCSDEVRILALHGILHLAGYDHEDDRGEMARTEQLLRQKLDLPAGLIERSGDSKPATAARRARAGK